MCRTLQSATKIFLINSVGAFDRQQAKISNVDSLNVKSRDLNEEIFELQIDLMAQARLNRPNEILTKMASICFTYTPTSLTLQHVAPPAGRRYRIPDHSRQLVDWLGNSERPNTGYRPFDVTVRK